MANHGHSKRRRKGRTPGERAERKRLAKTYSGKWRDGRLYNKDGLVPGVPTGQEIKDAEKRKLLEDKKRFPLGPSKAKGRGQRRNKRWQSSSTMSRGWRPSFWRD